MPPNPLELHTSCFAPSHSSSRTFLSIHLLLQLGGNAEPISDDAKTHVILKACSTGTGQVPWHLARWRSSGSRWRMWSTSRPWTSRPSTSAMRIATKTRVEKEDGRIVSRYPVLKQGGMIRGFAPGTRSSLQLQRLHPIDVFFHGFSPPVKKKKRGKMKLGKKKKKKEENEIQLKRLAGHFKSWLLTAGIWKTRR